MVFVGVVLFLCKQKTAYEVRISDWSSDVCSSDLGVRDRQLAAGAARDPLVGVQAGERTARSDVDEARRVRQLRARVGKRQLVGDRRAPSEIGRASCRERVCKYV